MTSGRLSTFIRRLRGAVGGRAAGALTDADLLERFVRGRDEAAFEVLVWRHGAMVLNVCLRVLRREHDAEDAFQATFLTLASKAGAIGNRPSLAGWLYKVAYRVALRARVAPPTRPLPEDAPADSSAGEPITRLFHGEFRAALDEEVERLPEKYRIAFVLCHLEGRTTEAAARSLDCPPGTVGTRVARARELLRRRLTRRGFDQSSLTATRNVVAAAPAALLESTLKAVLLGTADKAAAAGAISARVAALTKGALRTMSILKWTRATAVVLALSLLGGGAFLAHRAVAVESAQKPAVPPAGDKAAEVVLRWKFEKDRPFYQVATTETDMDMKVLENAVGQTQKQTFTFRWTPVEEERGDWRLKQKIVGVTLDLDLGGNKIQFDSTKEGNASPPVAECYKALIGAEFQVTLDKDGKASKVEGREEFVKKIGDANPSIHALVNLVLREEVLRQMAETGFAGLPRGAVEPGDSWTRKSRVGMGPLGGIFKTTYTYTYEGREGKLDKITVESALGQQAPAEDVAGLPYKIKKSKLKGAGTGTILFDREKGRIVSLELIQKMEGELTIAINDADATVEVSQTQKTTVKTMDANPIPAARPADDPKEVERLRDENERLKRENERLKRRLQAVEDALRGDGKPKD